MSTNCQQNYPYPSNFYPQWFVGDGIDCIAAAYVAYYTAVYGADVNDWPAGAQSEYGAYAPFELPAGYQLEATIMVNDGSDVPIGFWASDAEGILNLVFRGTEGTTEWIEDGSISQVPNTITNSQGLAQGCVESGFLSVHQNLTESLTNQYESLTAQGLGSNGLFIMGHSLGAALCELAATELSNQTTDIWIYNIGCPRVGSDDFVTTLDTLVSNYFRVTSGWDIIPDLPPVMIDPLSGNQTLYEHAGQQCPIYTSEFAFLANMMSDPLYGHHLSTYKTGLQNLIDSGVASAITSKLEALKA